MAYDEVNGRLAIVDDARGGVALYNVDDLLAANTEPVQVIETRGPACALCLKQFGELRVLLIASKLDSSVSVYDASNLQLIKQIPVESTYYVGFLTASKNPEDPYVLYLLTGRYNNLEIDSQTSTCGRIDLRNMELDPDFAVEDSHRLSRIPHAAISDDGSVVYYSGMEIGRNTTYWPEKTEERPNISYVDKRPWGITKYTVDPHNKFVATGPHILPFACGGESQHVEFEPKACFRNLPYIIGVHEQDLVIGSTNGFRQLESVSFPNDLITPSDQHRRRHDSWGGRDFRLHRIHCSTNDLEFFDAVADDERNLGIVVLHQAIVLVPLKNFDLPGEPQLAVAGNPETSLFVNQDLSVPLRSYTSGTKFEVASFTGEENPPAIKGNMLHWTPSAKQVGYHHIGLRATKGDASYEWVWPFAVRRKHVEVPFPIKRIVVEPSKRETAVVWGYTREFDARNNVKNVQWSVGYVDLINKKLISHRSLPAHITSAAISSRNIYVIESSKADLRVMRALPGEKLLQLKLPDLETNEELSVTSPTKECRVIADRFLALSFEHDTMRYSIPKLKEVDSTLPVAKSFDKFQRVRDGWLWDGYYWDEELRKPRLLLWPNHRAVSVRQGKQFAIPSTPFDLPGSVKYGTDASVAYGTKEDWNNRRKDRKFPLSLRFYPSRQGFSYSTSHTNHANLTNWGNDALLSLYNDRLFVLPFSQFPVDQYARPQFRIEPVQSEFTINLSKKSKVRYQARGAISYTLELRTSLVSGRPLTQTSRDGEFTIDLRTMSSGLVSQVMENIAGPSWTSTRRSGKGEELLDKYLVRTRAQFKPIHPRKFKGVPKLVFATVTAKNSSGDEAILNHCYLTELPLRLVRDNLRKESRGARR